jgi:hypothetical protein
MPTHTLGWSWESGTNTIAGAYSATGNAEINFDQTIADAGDASLSASLTVANCESVVLHATQDMRIHVNGVNEVQTLTPSGTISGGTFTLTYSSQTTGAIAHNATAADIKTALEALSNIGVNDVSVTGGPINTTAVVVTFRNALAATNVSQMTLTSSLTGGGSVAVSTTTAGVAASQTINLKANATEVYVQDLGYRANPLTANWTTGILVSNNSGAPGNFYARVLYN